MANFVGKWQIVNSENFVNYMIDIGIPEQKRKDALQFLGDDSKLSYEISNSVDNWEFKITTPAGEKTMTFTLGAEFDGKTLDGRDVKITFSLDGGALKEVQKGDGFETTNVRVVNGNAMTMTMTSGGGVSCTRTYNKV